MGRNGFKIYFFNVTEQFENKPAWQECSLDDPLLAYRSYNTHIEMYNVLLH
jgi:hypothetical protein